MTLLLTRNIQINHAELGAAHHALRPGPGAGGRGAATGDHRLLSQLDALVNQQALMISYIDDFKLMMIVTMAAIPLALLLRRPGQAQRQQG